RCPPDCSYTPLFRSVFFLDIDRLPLPGACRRFLQPPVVAEQQLEVAVVPLRRVSGPGAFDAAGHGVAADATLGLVDPAQALIIDIGGFWIRTQQFGSA